MSDITKSGMSSTMNAKIEEKGSTGTVDVATIRTCEGDGATLRAQSNERLNGGSPGADNFRPGNMTGGKAIIKPEVTGMHQQESGSGLGSGTQPGRSGD